MKTALRKLTLCSLVSLLALQFANADVQITTLTNNTPVSIPSDKVATLKSAFIYLPNADSALIVTQLYGTFQGESIIFPATILNKVVPTEALTGKGQDSAGSPEVPLTIEGPVDLQIVFTAGEPGTNAKVNVVMEIRDKVIPISTVSTTIPQASVVIPSDTTGNVQILLESSTDLVNWNTATPGLYGASTENRFFRVRAKKE